MVDFTRLQEEAKYEIAWEWSLPYDGTWKLLGWKPVGSEDWHDPDSIPADARQRFTRYMEGM